MISLTNFRHWWWTYRSHWIGELSTHGSSQDWAESIRPKTFSVLQHCHTHAETVPNASGRWTVDAVSLHGNSTVNNQQMNTIRTIFFCLDPNYAKESSTHVNGASTFEEQGLVQLPQTTLNFKWIRPKKPTNQHTKLFRLWNKMRRIERILSLLLLLFVAVIVVRGREMSNPEPKLWITS